MTPVFVLTLRSLLRGRRLLAVALLLAIPVLIAVVYRATAPYARLTNPGDHPFERSALPFLVQLFDGLALPVLLPLAALVFAASVLGGEVEDRTLLYLTLRPVSRLAVAVAKGLAAALVTLALVETSLALMYLIVAQGVSEAGTGLPGLGAILLAGAAGSVAYCSLFLLLGLLAPRRALLIGFLYVLLWEGTAAGFSTGLATLSVRRYVEGTLHAGLSTVGGGRLVWPADPSAATSAVVVCAIVVVGLALTTYRLRRMELP